jgi:hypothetical protein
MKITHLLITAALATSAMSVTVPSVAAAASKPSYEKNEKGEKTIPLKDLPSPTRATALREAKGGKLLKVEEMPKGGETVYEAVIRKGKEDEGVVINAKGHVIDRHSEKSEK